MSGWLSRAAAMEVEQKEGEVEEATVMMGAELVDNSNPSNNYFQTISP